MSELVDALEEFAGELAVEGYEGKFNLVHQAVGRIEQLEAALKPFAAMATATEQALGRKPSMTDGWVDLKVRYKSLDEARALLKGR